MTINLTSTAFQNGQPIPKRHTADGDDLSPPLAWSNLPAGTKQLALVCDDPDAPRPEKPAAKPWVHWVIYNITADSAALPEGVGWLILDPAGSIQGNNSWPTIGYRGPAPPPGSGTHRYFFKLYALDAELNLQPGIDKDKLLAEIKGHVLAGGELVGTYQR